MLDLGAVHPARPRGAVEGGSLLDLGAVILLLLGTVAAVRRGVGRNIITSRP